jgi:hypothetical protein
MKKLEIKLDQVVKLLLFGNFPNKQELLNGYENLKKLFNSPFPQEFFLEIISELRANPFYRQFKLDADPCFLKALVNKVNRFEIIEQLLQSSEINYSQQEEMVLEQRLNILISLSFLEQDLKEAKDSEEEGQLCLDDFFEVYFEELDKLKTILSSESISIKNIDWFFESDLFQFISGASDCFDVELVDLYKILLEDTEIKTKKDFISHKQILENAKKEIRSFDYEAFYAVLSNTKKQLEDNLRSSPCIPVSTTCNISIFKKFSKLTKLSPIAKKALLNNLKEYKDSPHLNNFKR